MLEKNDMIHDIEVEVHQKLIITKITVHKTDTVLPLEIVLVMTKALLLHNTLVHGMTVIKETRELIAASTNHLTDMTFVTDIGHAHVLEITTSHDTHLPLDHLRAKRF